MLMTNDHLLQNGQRLRMGIQIRITEGTKIQRLDGRIYVEGCQWVVRPTRRLCP